MAARLDTPPAPERRNDLTARGPTGSRVVAPHRDAARGDGRLVAVCGLCGGAGASTLSYLIARVAAADSDRPVLVCDTGGSTGGLAACAGVEAPRSLAEAADLIALNIRLSGRLWAVDPRVGGGELRVIATGPRFSDRPPPAALERLLADAKAAHALTVVDCGRLERDAERLTLRLATHLAWVVPATASGLARGRKLLDSFPLQLDAREIVVARRIGDAESGALKHLKALAAERRAALVLVPELPESVDLDRAVDAAQVPLQAIAGLLAR